MLHASGQYGPIQSLSIFLSLSDLILLFIDENKVYVAFPITYQYNHALLALVRIMP
jgi:hypothetical protein